jgi:hypothetical protein
MAVKNGRRYPTSPTTQFRLNNLQQITDTDGATTAKIITKRTNGNKTIEARPATDTTIGNVRAKPLV